MSDKDEKNKKSKKGEKPVDDGRVIADMNVEGFSWYRKNGYKKTKQEQKQDTPTSKEMWAMIIAAYKAYLPYFLIMLGVLVAVFLIGFLLLQQ